MRWLTLNSGLPVGLRHPLPDHVLAAQSAVANEMPLRVFGAVLQETFESPFEMAELAACSNCFCVSAMGSSDN